MSSQERLGAIQIDVDESPAKWKVIDNLDPGTTLSVSESNQINLFIGAGVGSVHWPGTMKLALQLLQHVLSDSLYGHRNRSPAMHFRGRTQMRQAEVKRWVSIDPCSLKILLRQPSELTEAQVVDILRGTDGHTVLVRLDAPKNSIEVLLRDLISPLGTDTSFEQKIGYEIANDEARTVQRLQRIRARRPMSHRDSLPMDSEASAQRRLRLLADDWYTSAQVGALLGSAAGSNPNQYAARLRKAGKLLGVWVVAENAYRHPPCQFSGGGVLSQMADLLQWLPGPSGSGWEQAEWLYSPHALLKGQTPADVLPAHPDRVVSAAAREYGEDKDAGW